jgi:glutamyl-tRNA synthetase
LVAQRLEHLDIAYESGANFDNIVDLYRQRVSTINELVDSILYCFQDFDEYDAKAAKKALREVALEPLQMLLDELSLLENWQVSDIHGVIEKITQKLELNMGKVGQPLRVAVTGGSFSPPIDETVEMIGKTRTITRINKAIEFISAK